MFTQIAQQQMPEPIPTSEFIKFVGSYLLVADCILIGYNKSDRLECSHFLPFLIAFKIFHVCLLSSLYLFKGSYNNSFNNILK